MACFITTGQIFTATMVRAGLESRAPTISTKLFQANTIKK